MFHNLGLGSAPSKKKSGSRREPVSVETLHQMRCEACPLNKLEPTLQHPKMRATGSRKPLVYMLGEGPGCISGDSLIDTAFRDKSKFPDGIPIRDLVGQRDFYVYSFDVKNQTLVLGKVKRVWRTGRKKIYRVTYEWSYAHGEKKIYVSDSLDVTSNHRFLLKRPRWKDPFKGANDGEGDYLSIDQGLSVGHSLQPFFRRNSKYGRVGIAGHCLISEARFLLEWKIGRPLLRRRRRLSGLQEREECHHSDENKLNDSCDNLILHTTSSHARHHMLENNPMSDPVSRERHKEALASPAYRKNISRKLKKYLSDPNNYEKRLQQIERSRAACSKTVAALHRDPVYKYRYLMSRKSHWRNWSYEDVERRFRALFPDEDFPPHMPDNHLIINIEYVGVEDVYDMEVEDYHNFVANGVFVHNSNEDKQGEQFVGKAGKLLREYVPEDVEVRWNNCVRCRPPENRTPVYMEIESCRPWIVEDIEKTKPFAIFALGAVPLHWAIGGSGQISTWRGRYMPVKVGSHVCWLFTFVHPSYLSRMRKKGRSGNIIKSDMELIFKRDMKRAFKLLETLPEATVLDPRESPSSAPDGSGTITAKTTPTSSPAVARAANGYRKFTGVNYVTGNAKGDLQRVADWLDRFKQAKVTALDLETSTSEKVKDRQTRPYGRDAKILTVAISDDKDSFAFPLHHPQAGWTSVQRKQVMDLLVDYLENARGIKVAQNLSFELEWLAYFYGKEIVYAGEWGDTMAQAYVLDEREGALSLDDLTVLHFGFHIKSLFKFDMGAMDQADLESVLVYNALDAFWERKLFIRQRSILKAAKLQQVYEMHVPPIQASVLTQHFGNPINFELVDSLDKKYRAKIAEVQESIKEFESIQYFERSQRRPFKLASHQDVIILFRDILKVEEGWQEDENGKRKYSMDEEILAKLEHEEAKLIVEYRGAAGNKSKYIDGMKKEANEFIFPDGRVHPNLHILKTRTGRTSSSYPNSQFWPKRDDNYKELRAEFEAEEDCWLAAIDQGQIEARVIGMAAKDKAYGTYLWDRNDVHMVWTERLAYAYPARIGGKKFIRDKDVMKKFRTDVKNQWTFPLFYGASLNSVSRYLTMPADVLKPLVDQFWQEFSGVKAWQEELEEFYDRFGYVECLTGRRRRGPISHNKIINSPIQGTASDITVSAWCRLSRYAHETGQWQFQARQEIHDELCFQLPKKTFDRDLEIIVDFMLECAHFPFIDIPLCVEVNRGPDWYHQEHVMTVFSDDLSKIDRRSSGY